MEPSGIIVEYGVPPGVMAAHTLVAMATIEGANAPREKPYGRVSFDHGP